MPTPAAQPHTVEGLLRVIEARDSELALLKLMVDKLKLQLLRRMRAEFGTSSEQLAAQATLIDSEAVLPAPPVAATAQPAAANAPAIDRSLPAHLPRQAQEHRPEATATHHDSAGRPCGCVSCGGGLRQIGQDVSEQLEYVPAHFRVTALPSTWRCLRRAVAVVTATRSHTAIAPTLI